MQQAIYQVVAQWWAAYRNYVPQLGETLVVDKKVELKVNEELHQAMSHAVALRRKVLGEKP